MNYKTFIWIPLLTTAIAFMGHFIFGNDTPLNFYFMSGLFTYGIALGIMMMGNIVKRKNV